MLEFKTEKVTDRITGIYAFCTELMYLVEGDEKADGVIALCEDIKSGNVDDLPLTFRGNSGLIAKAMGPDGRVDGGHGNIVYNKQNIWKNA